MLTQEPPNHSPATYRRGPVGRGTTILLTLAVLVVLALRHDFWNWETPYPLLGGILPVGLWWQGLVSLLAVCLMWLMVRLAWPGHLEEQAEAAEQQRHCAKQLTEAAATKESADRSPGGRA